MIELPDVKGLVVAVDTETSGLYVDDGARLSAISISYDLDGVRVSKAYPFDHGVLDKPGVKASLFDTDVNLDEGDYLRLMAWLGSQRLVFHKMYFDLQILRAGHRKWGGGRDYTLNAVWDTKLAQWVIEPTENTHLKGIAARLWGEDEKAEQDALKPWLKKNGNRFDLVPWDVMEPYSAKDADLTLRLYEHQQQLLETGFGHLREHINLEIEVARVLTRMSYRGIGYDVNRSRMEGKKAKLAMAEIDKQLPFSPATPAEARKYFFGKAGAIPHCVTEKKGIPSVSECCVRSLIAQNVPGADLYATRMKIMHAVGVYYDGFADAAGEDGRLRTDWKQDGTVTMRFSSNRVNLQALPHDHQLERLTDAVPPRALFKAKEEFALWEFDLAQAEARVAAKYAKCDAWLRMFDEGRDLHGETAMTLFGSKDFENRQVAKRANFSLIYGVGPATFGRSVEKFTGIKLLDAEAKKIVSDWRALYPEFPAINLAAERVADRRGFVVLADGRQRYFGPFEEKQKAFNAVIQGSIAQFVKRWMLKVDDEDVARVLLQIHDSLVVEILAEMEDKIVDSIKMVGGRMATEMFSVPMEAEAKRW